MCVCVWIEDIYKEILTPHIVRIDHRNISRLNIKLLTPLLLYSRKEYIHIHVYKGLYRYIIHRYRKKI